MPLQKPQAFQSMDCSFQTKRKPARKGVPCLTRTKIIRKLLPVFTTDSYFYATFGFVEKTKFRPHQFAFSLWLISFSAIRPFHSSSKKLKKMNIKGQSFAVFQTSTVSSQHCNRQLFLKLHTSFSCHSQCLLSRSRSSL